MAQLTVFVFSLFLLHHHQVTSNHPEEMTQDKQSLLSFIKQVNINPKVSWNENDPFCSWKGITCDATNSTVIYLRLPAVSLVGKIPLETIGMLSQLRVLSLHTNGLIGDIPSDFSNLISLQQLYLHKNKFSGQLPPSLFDLTSLIRLDLSVNNFSGEVPDSINKLTNLEVLLLQYNSFSGSLPSINTASLVELNLANNKLNSSIPKSLSRFPKSAFSGNIYLCSDPLPPCNITMTSSPSSVEPPVVEKKPKKKLSTGAIIGIAFGSVFVLSLLFLSKQRTKSPLPTSKAASGAVGIAGTSSSKEDVTGTSTEGERNRLVFIDGGIYSFDLKDLLRASAEILGIGSVGTSYKTVPEEGTTVVVKRLKDVVVTKNEFDLQMEVLGKMKNENVVPLRGFYSSKEEKFLVYDYMPTGSLFALLHGSRSTLGRTPLDWDDRLRIALSAARGVLYLHVAGNLVHGNIKSSNILITQNTNKHASVSDYGLNKLFSGSSSSNHRAPEILDARKVTFKSDVYSFGVLLSEILTGKAPHQATLGGERVDLPRWVRSYDRADWSGEVFDVELRNYQNSEEDMVRLMQIALVCVSTVADQRPTMHEVVRMIEDIIRVQTIVE